MYDAVMECGSDADWNGNDDPNNHDGCYVYEVTRIHSREYLTQTVIHFQTGGGLVGDIEDFEDFDMLSPIGRVHSPDRNQFQFQVESHSPSSKLK